MKIDRSQEWWLAKALEENATVGAASPRSKKTLSPIELTEEQKAYLMSLARRDEAGKRDDGL